MHYTDTPWARQYFAHISERREMAAIRFRNSGYRDHAAWDEFLRWYKECQRVAPERTASLTTWRI